MKTYFGVDISKDTFDVAFSSDGRLQHARYGNTPSGIESFIRTLPAHSHVVMEATGTYSMRLAYALCERRTAVSVINPKQSRHFSQMMMQTTKSDRKDAHLLLLFGQQINPKPLVPQSGNILRVKQLRTTLNKVKQHRKSLGNIVHSLDFHVCPDGFNLSVLEEQIRQHDLWIARINNQINSIMETEYEDLMRLLTSIKGIGKVVATALIDATNGFGGFDNPKQLSRFLGISPTHYQSGSSVRKTARMNRCGDPTVRNLLFMSARSAMRYNPQCKALYDRLRERGKPGMVALGAVMNKLVRQAFGVVKSGQAYDPRHEAGQANQKTLHI